MAGEEDLDQQEFTLQHLAGWMQQQQQLISLMQSQSQTTLNLLSQNTVAMNTLAESQRMSTANSETAALNAEAARHFARAAQGGTATTGNLSNCRVKVNGLAGEDLDLFLSTVNACREANNVQYANAITSLPCLLLGNAGAWWKTVKSSVKDWIDFERLIRHTYGEQSTNTLVI